MSLSKTAAKLRCTRCGAEFACDPAGDCWCKDETFRVPMPKAGAESCLCPACLRTMADGKQSHA
ncbi:MAG TPA: cysteine-rich CWC family protein [Alphaproteobacteria bacterium]|nr:cysteine-rich CWC family protein [Alphaproteobacteria bacterium]